MPTLWHVGNDTDTSGNTDYDRALSMQAISMYSVLGALDSAHENFGYEVIKTGILYTNCIISVPTGQ